ncbi:MAG: hypothetical protein Q7R52_01390 [archaeon]|nr:hypothetical protein [archaeon]
MSLRLNILEQLLATEFDVGYEQELILIKNVRNPTTGMIEFNTQKKVSNSGMCVEELVKKFYEQSGFNVNQIEHENYDRKSLKILRFSAEKQNSHKHNYLITIVKTPYTNIISINQTE